MINLPNDTIIDGEIVVSNENRRPSFEETMERFMLKKSKYHIRFCVFDIPGELLKGTYDSS
ncbi:MAG TPA: hypothetical protein VEY70_11600 [Metabacillus sp.]|nr:hypothetical protein [Metabacillus sp.]